MAKLQIYKVGINWILWVPGVRIYRFPTWRSALNFALQQAPVLAKEGKAAPLAATAGAS